MVSGTENVPLTTLLVVTTETIASPMRIDSSFFSGSSTFSSAVGSGEIGVPVLLDCSSGFSSWLTGRLIGSSCSSIDEASIGAGLLLLLLLLLVSLSVVACNESVMKWLGILIEYIRYVTRGLRKKDISRWLVEREDV